MCIYQYRPLIQKRKAQLHRGGPNPDESNGFQAQFACNTSNKIRHIGNCFKADPAYGKGVAAALGIPTSEAPV